MSVPKCVQAATEGQGPDRPPPAAERTEPSPMGTCDGCSDGWGHTDVAHEQSQDLTLLQGGHGPHARLQARQVGVWSVSAGEQGRREQPVQAGGWGVWAVPEERKQTPDQGSVGPCCQGPGRLVLLRGLGRGGSRPVVGASPDESGPLPAWPCARFARVPHTGPAPAFRGSRGVSPAPAWLTWEKGWHLHDGHGHARRHRP